MKLTCFGILLLAVALLFNACQKDLLIPTDKDAQQPFNAHPQYDAMIESRLTSWALDPDNAGYTPNDAFYKLNEIIEQVRTAIAANSTTHINNITIP